MAKHTPTIDKARTEELSTYELAKALGELGALNGPGTQPGIIAEFNWHGSLRWQVRWSSGDLGKAHETPEDAIAAAADELLKQIADEEDLDERLRAEREQPQSDADIFATILDICRTGAPR